jgi:hypothetical protein
MEEGRNSSELVSKKGRHHAHAVKPGNGRRSRRKLRKLILVPGVLLNGQAYAYTA